MSKNIFILSLLIIMSALFGCGEAVPDYVITPADEITILEYLDTNTSDIILPSYGTVFSTFELLGTDKNKVYIWATIIEYENRNNTIISNQTVSLPIVLSISKNDSGIVIKSHMYPDDGIYYGKSRDRLFPSDIIHNFPDNETRKKLESQTRERAEAELLS